jgi:8-oxo-dGTP pyrophosphatase MutT (NUDIX family)
VAEEIFQLGIKAVVRNNHGQILLLQVNPAKLRNWQGDAYWDLPGGRIHKGATVLETLHREIREETGIGEIQDPRIITSVVANIRIPLGGDDVGLILMIYSCRVLDSVAIRVSDEHLEARWFEAIEAARLLTVKYPPEFTQAIENIDV